jgi:hypothetical protein
MSSRVRAVAVGCLLLFLSVATQAEAQSSSAAGATPGSTLAVSEPPLNLTAQISGDDVVFSWLPPAGSLSGFRVQAGSVAGASDRADAVVGSVSHLAVSRVPAGTYYVRVRAFDASGVGPPSNEVVVTIASAAPGAPTDLMAQVSGTDVSLSWTAPPGSVWGYRVEAGTSPGGSNVADVMVGPAPLLTATNVPSGAYYVRIRAFNHAGVGEPSNEVRLISDAPRCAVPPTPTGESIEVRSSSVSVSWQPVGVPATTYVLEVGSQPLSDNLGRFRVGSATAVRTMAPNGTYFIRVRAVDVCGIEGAATADSMIVVGGTPPRANAGPDRSVNIGQTAQLDGGGSTDPDGESVSFRWSFLSRPAGSAALLSNSATAAPAFVVDVAGTFVVQLIVSDREFVSVADTVAITGTSTSPGVLTVGAANYGFSLGAYRSAPVFVQGGDGNYSWSITEGSLPPGLAFTNDLEAGVTCAGPPSACVAISGVPTAIGIYPFTIRATDGALRTGTKAVEYYVTTRPTVATTTLPPGEKDVPYMSTLHASGGDGVDYTWSIDSGSLPAGLTLVAETGQIVGTPSSGGHASFVVRVTTRGGAAQRYLGLAVAFGPVPPSASIAVMRDTNQSCQLRQNQLTCWGEGRGSWYQRLPVPAAGDLSMREIISNACGLTVNGEAVCWTGGFDQPPIQLPGAANLVGLRSFRPETCGLTAGGSIVCWVLVYSSPESAPTVTGPFHLSGHLPYVSLADGNYDSNHKCALTAGGQAYCWGSNAYGQLGNGSTMNAPEDQPVQVSGGHIFAALTLSIRHTCGVTTAGAIYCWGDNERGALGVGPGVGAASEPIRVNSDETFKPRLTSNRYLTCAATVGGAAYCWGNIGIAFAMSISSWTPQLLPGGVAFETVSTNHRRICGLDADGAAYCAWDGPLGDGSETDSLTPVRVLVAPP